jgi:hypothetical protein
MLLRLVLLGFVRVVAAAAFFVSVWYTSETRFLWREVTRYILLSHHLSFPRRPLARRTTFVAVVDLLFDFISELGVGVFFFGGHG